MSGAVIALDLGGTKIAGAVVAPGGTILVRGGRPTPAAEGAASVLDALADAVRELSASAGASGAHPVAIGIAAAGIIDPAAGTVVSATTTIRDWTGTALGPELAARTGLPVACDNDVRAAAATELGTADSGSAETLVYLSVGTGVGGAVAVGGRMLTGRQGVAGHLGHLPSPEAEGLPCTCGAVGHLEAIAAGPGMAALYARLTGAQERGTVLPLEQVAELAEAGDRAAAEALATGARAAGRMLGGLANALGPNRVVVGGGVPRIGPRYWAPLRASFAAELLPPLSGGMRLQAPRHGSDAPLLGAAALPSTRPLHRAPAQPVFGGSR